MMKFSMMARWFYLTLVLFQWNVFAFPTKELDGLIMSSISSGAASSGSALSSSLSSTSASSEIYTPNYQSMGEQYESDTEYDLFGEQLKTFQDSATTTNANTNKNNKNNLLFRRLISDVSRSLNKPQYPTNRIAQRSGVVNSPIHQHRRSVPSNPHPDNSIHLAQEEVDKERVKFSNDLKFIASQSWNATAHSPDTTAYYVSGVLNLHSCRDGNQESDYCNHYCNRSEWHQIFRNECGKTAIDQSLRAIKKREAPAFENENHSLETKVASNHFSRDQRSHLFLTPDVFQTLVLPDTAHWRTVWKDFLSAIQVCCPLRPKERCSPQYIRHAIIAMCKSNYITNKTVFEGSK